MIKKSEYIIATVSTGGLLSLTMLVGMFLASSTTSADVVDDINITVPIACNFSETGDTTDTPHTATINPGTYQEDIGKTTFKVFCNDSSGYALYAIGYSNEEYGNTNLLPANTAFPSIATGLATSGDVSAWAMKLNPVAGTYTPTIESDTNGSFANYHIVPDTYTKVATFTSTTDFTIGSSLTSTYRAYVHGLQPADTYNGKVKYTLVHPNDAEPLQPQPSASGKICYYANAADAEGTMGCQDVASSVDLLASNFSRAGYGFAGWSDAFDYDTNTNAHFYGPQETITIPDTSIYTGEGKGLSLYAVWVKSTGNIQSWNGCSSLTPANTATNILKQSITALSDQRDNNTYAIARLADGNCWMIENLRLENTGTDNTNGSLAQGYGGQFAGLAAPETAWANDSTDANSLYTTEADVQGKNTISGSIQGYRFPRYNHDNTNSRASSPTTNSTAMYSYGNYYTWAAAIADTTNYTTNNQSVTNASICPSGWHLPKGGDKTRIESNDDNDFWNLTVDALNGGTNPANYDSLTSPYYNGKAEAGPVADKLRSYPNNFVYSGYVYSGSVSYRGSDGTFWSSTAGSSLRAYYLSLGSSVVYPGTSSVGKYYGRTVRCVVSGV